MVVQKVDVLIAMFSYAGNGGVSAILPEIAFWHTETAMKMKADPRIGRMVTRRYGDIPLTMERNRVVKDAKEGGFDIIVMLDSDNVPDGYLGKRPWAQPFWDSSFDFAFERLMRGIPSVVCAPYCGPPPHPVNGGEENVYVFHATNDRSDEGAPGYRFEAYSRQHAAQMRGIQEISAGPTGVILYTTSAFDLMPIDRRPMSEILADLVAGTINPVEAERKLKMQSWFWYEFTDQYQTQKASTEDVTNTREIQMAGLAKYKEPIVFCNWNAWALHGKPKYVGMPEPVRMESVSSVFQEAVINNVSAFEESREVDFTDELKDIRPKAWPPLDPNLPVSLCGSQAEDEVYHPHDDASAEQQYDSSGSFTKPIGQVIDEIFGTADKSTISVPTKARMVAGRKVTTVGHETDINELNALTKLASLVGKQKEGVPLKMAEIGSWVGESAIALLGGAPDDSTIYCIDTWEGTPSDRTGKIAKNVDVWKYFEQNAGEMLGNGIRPLMGKSEDVAKTFDDPQELDLLFIDGDHTREGVLADLDAWYRHVSIYGMLCGHDYCEMFPGTIQAVNEWLGQYGAKPHVIPGTSIWFITKAAVEHAKAASRPSPLPSVAEAPQNAQPNS